MIHCGGKKPVARSYKLVGFERFEVNRADSHGSAQVASRRRLNHHARGRRIFVRREQTHDHCERDCGAASKHQDAPPATEVLDNTEHVERFRHGDCLWDSVADMAIVLPAVVALLPLILAPHLLFYFDVTPKILVLLVGTAVALLVVSRSKRSRSA